MGEEVENKKVFPEYLFLPNLSFIKKTGQGELSHQTTFSTSSKADFLKDGVQEVRKLFFFLVHTSFKNKISDVPSRKRTKKGAKSREEKFQLRIDTVRGKKISNYG